MFELSRDSSVPLVEQICERLSQLVRDGQLSAGTRLPSIRRLAKQIHASPFTVVDAYERLVARGLIESRAGRGFFVTPRRLSAPLTAVEALPDPATDAMGLTRLTLSQCADLIPAGSGFLPENWLLEASLHSELTRLAKSRRAQLWLRHHLRRLAGL
jgi:DNA-binding transcriptional regulator YhcF (GntR family)